MGRKRAAAHLIHTIVLMRHAKTDMKWNARYDSAGFDAACEAYAGSRILPDAIPEDLRGKAFRTSSR